MTFKTRQIIRAIRAKGGLARAGAAQSRRQSRQGTGRTAYRRRGKGLHAPSCNMGAALLAPSLMGFLCFHSDVTDVCPYSALTHAGRPDVRKCNNRFRRRVERKLGSHKRYTDHVPRKVGIIVVCRQWRSTARQHWKRADGPSLSS